MPRFDRYLLAQLLAVFGFFALVLVAVYWVNRAVGLFDQLIGDGQTAVVFLEFSLLTLPNVIRVVLPVAAFAAAVYVANRLMQESELVVMQATGFSSFRLARPVLWFGLIVTLAALVLAHVLVPLSREALSARYAEIRQNVTARFLTDGAITHPGAGLTLYIRELAPSGELLGLFLTDARDAAAVTTYTAEKALFARTDSGPKLLMFNGMAQQVTGPDRRLSLTRFADFTYDLGGLLPEAAPGTRTIDALSTAELLAADTALLAETGATRAAFLYDAHNRFAQPFLAVAAALIGFAALLMGNFSRFGLWRQVGLAVGLLVLVQAVASVATGLGLRSDRGWIWAYAAPVFGTALGVALLWWSQRPRRVAAGQGGLA
ncbi:LPS export ABC transporter permease LptF [Tabrizicola oligotrophica]|uniref:LPS export ABC transporter permease LptF n=1 Tax=Tabrizicola oligotrophica TaxID=2710650 RepID=A0A6M0QP25_9RHOB|nr:LPS export ABC transporter permease LptF [Tabrizicola oligotrophica]NEY89179.1 LPS export ABC transporter permease LptF [Tabrizicola oligotrophica]